MRTLLVVIVERVLSAMAHGLWRVFSAAFQRYREARVGLDEVSIVPVSAQPGLGTKVAEKIIHIIFPWAHVDGADDITWFVGILVLGFATATLLAILIDQMIRGEGLGARLVRMPRRWLAGRS